MSYILGIDVGGTFTDFVAYNEESREVTVWKDFSTPGDPSDGILNGLRQFPRRNEISGIRLGTTIATNAILERNGANVAFVTTQGFRDVPFIQRGNRRFHFNSRWVKPQPLIQRANSFEVVERVDCDGNVIVPLDEDSLRQVADRIAARGDIKAISVCFLFSYINPQHEIIARDYLASRFPDLPISISYDVLPKWKEYERASTTIADAYVKPIVTDQLGELETRIAEAVGAARVVVTKSNGGQTTVAGACEAPVQMTLSGPTGGVVAAQFISSITGEKNFVTIDMGGTSTDCSLIVNGKASLTTDFEVEWGIPIQVPMLDVRTIGAGGGSIAWIDKGGLLRVGPESARSRPGPICYGRGGTEPTVTDANLVLGRINPDNFLGGTVTLDVDGARAGVKRLAERLSLSVDDAALAVVKIVNNNMVGAVRSVLIEKGESPDKFSLMFFGGAGPVHACDLLKDLSMSRAIIPIHPGQFSAFGFTATDARVDRQRTVQMTSNRMDFGRATQHLKELEADCLAQLDGQGFKGDITIERRVELRYHGQNYELSLPLRFTTFSDATAKELWASFDKAHEERFGFNIPGEFIEIVNFNVAAVKLLSKPQVPTLARSTSAPKPVSMRSVGYEEGRHDTPVYRREELAAGDMIQGPAVIEEAVSVVVLHPNQELLVDDYGNLHVSERQAR
ncbi:MAG: hydantoinase/oxoprolinase family protein [Mesorhizobium sp.]|uniref:hydantoinase/oxoprolinase family protein n=1 Tax=Mesorhizobium sp. TaxID=1871066 RepID=UPI000FE669A3|nr:hydantoinase/oxoprolinase family protein [Mesorhizobium sp.]RWM88749.1 MAG: hydantoinase/oxoprolinase family protein [Mesorhizobium sp.]